MLIPLRSATNKQTNDALPKGLTITAYLLSSVCCKRSLPNQETDRDACEWALNEQTELVNQG